MSADEDDFEARVGRVYEAMRAEAVELVRGDISMAQVLEPFPAAWAELPREHPARTNALSFFRAQPGKLQAMEATFAARP